MLRTGCRAAPVEGRAPRIGQFTEKRPRGRPRGCKHLHPHKTCAATRISKGACTTTSLGRHTHTHTHTGAALRMRWSAACLCSVARRARPFPGPHELHTNTPQPTPGCVAHTHSGWPLTLAARRLPWPQRHACGARSSPRDTPTPCPHTHSLKSSYTDDSASGGEPCIFDLDSSSRESSDLA